ncbi:MAG TPA: LLM class flavin-dependent oxidoreductase [Acetobacteraceae bacterium]|nr:LLM class flavin-dependent oxidoreductase [Acetobacteraceae bacterium]
MRLGIVTIPRPTPDGLVISRMVDLAHRVETLGFSGLWVTDAFGRGRPTLDPLILLAAVCAETHQIELGTCVVQLPLRHPVEHAHRVQSLNVLSGGRLRFGVGAGSTRADFDAVEANYEGRFKTLPAYLEIMRRAWNGHAVFGPALSAWPGTEAGPQVLLGAWRSARWIRLAAENCQGWIASGIFSNWEDLHPGLEMYRAAGGRRAVLANVFTDLRPDPVTTPAIAHAKISLLCTPREARERLKRIEQLGFDDALLVCPFDAPEQLETIRALI